MPRKSNWPAALTLFLNEKQQQPFDWKENNCSFFASDWVAILTGIDPAANYRASVDSALSAARVLAEAGGIESITEQECAANNWPEVSPRLAQRGDVCLVDSEAGPALGVVAGSSAAFAGPRGVEFVPVSACRRAWRIS